MRTLLLMMALAGCMDAADAEDGQDDSFVADGKADGGGIAEGSPEAIGVLAVVNDSTIDLRVDVKLAKSAATHIAAHPAKFTTLTELDAVPYVGSVAFGKLLSYAKAHGLVTGVKIGHGILLDCNTSLGPDQQVTVIGDGTKLTLRELTTSGSQEDKALTVAAWSAGKLTLRSDEFGTKSTLTKEDGGWVMRSSGGGVNEIGDADCWVDKSP
jgi:hypothetical protein